MKTEGSPPPPGASRPPTVAVVGAGPAGLMAADVLASAGLAVDVFDRMASPARKLLMAGRGGLNLTHAEPFDDFVGRYAGSVDVEAAIRAYPPVALRAWADDLGADTFVGSSRRVFPQAMKASPLLRAWLSRLDKLGVRLHMRHRLIEIAPGPRLEFSVEGADGPRIAIPDAVVLAMGGASWPRLGSDGSFASLLAQSGVVIAPLAPANCGLAIAWSEHLRSRFAGSPLKRVVLQCGDRRHAGELVVTRHGLEGGPAYAAASDIRRQLSASGQAALTLDLRPDLSLEALTGRLGAPRGKESTASFLRKKAGLSPVAAALLREPLRPPAPLPAAPADLADLIKNLPLKVNGLSGLDRAISTAGGVAAAALDARFMLKDLPGVFVAGEMLDWDAPTGGYLLQGTFSTARAAAEGARKWLQNAAIGSDHVPMTSR